MRECPAAQNVEGFDAQKSCRRRIVRNNDGNARSRHGANNNRSDHRRRSAEFLHFRWKRIFCWLDNLQLDAWPRPSIDVPRKGHQGHASYHSCDNLFGGDLGEHRRRKMRAEMMEQVQHRSNDMGATMLRIFAALIAVALCTTVARADCAGDCNRGYNSCRRHCGGVSMCEEGCAHGRSSCLRGCRRSRNFTPAPVHVTLDADRAEASTTAVGGNWR
jgi:hypothetical protein